MATEQHPTKVMAKLNAYDWSDLARLPGTGDTKLWLYSVGVNKGPRLMFNLSKPLLSDIESGSGSIFQISMVLGPLEAYMTALSEFDSQTSIAGKVEAGQTMAIATTAYVVAQKSWKVMVQDNSSNDKHMLVLDWETEHGPRCAQAGFITENGSMPDKETMVGVAMAIYLKHYGQKTTTIFDA